MCKISIITINYNNSIGLDETISSVIFQTYRNFEYIIIDGGSTDGSIEVLDKYTDNIDYWVSEPDSGIYNAMNKGILKANGEYILFLNSGDFLCNDKILQDIFIDENLDYDLIYGDLHRRFPDGTEDVVVMPDLIDVDYIRYNTLTHPTTFIRRYLFSKYDLYREDLQIVSDWAFFLKIITFANISRKHVSIVVSSFSMDGISSENENLVKEERLKVINESFSPELLEILGLFSIYRDFYNLRISKFIRRVKSAYNNIFSLTSWKLYFHKKRIHSIIFMINSIVRKQKRNPLLIPIIIINYNRLKDLQLLVSFLLERGHKNIVIIDNNSNYPPLLDYYSEIESRVIIERMKYNYGHLVFWKNRELYNKYAKGYHVITDSDIIPNSRLPQNYMKILMKVLDSYKAISKVGFALSIYDIPNYYYLKDKVLRWEKKYWLNEIKEGMYFADLDTTFALYPPYFFYKHIADFYKGIRIAGDFTAKHGGWYLDRDNMSEEDIFYFKTANSSNSWKLNDNESNLYK